MSEPKDIKVKCTLCNKEISLMEARSNFGYPVCEECFSDTIKGAF